MSVWDQLGRSMPADMNSISAFAPSTPSVPRKRGLFDRIGDELDKPHVRAALLREGIALLTGGNPMAGFQYMQQARDDEEEKRRWEIGEEDKRHEADRAMLATNGQLTHWDRGDDNNDYTAANNAAHQRGQLYVSRANNVDSNATSAANNIRSNTTSRQNTMDNNATSTANNIRSVDAQIYGIDSTRQTADANRAFQYGPESIVRRYDANGNIIEEGRGRAPNYGEIRYDAQGNPYRLDPFTRQAVPIPGWMTR